MKPTLSTKGNTSIQLASNTIKKMEAKKGKMNPAHFPAVLSVRLWRYSRIASTAPLIPRGTRSPLFTARWTAHTTHNSKRSTMTRATKLLVR